MMQLRLMAIALAVTMGVASAAAETYPARPIHLVIPYPPGGVMDAIGRPWADRIKAALGTAGVENIAPRWHFAAAYPAWPSPQAWWEAALNGGRTRDQR